MPLTGFHPAVATWFERTFGEPTPPQVEGWPAFRDGIPIAFREGSETHFLEEPSDERLALTQALRRQPVPRAVRAYLGNRP